LPGPAYLVGDEPVETLVDAPDAVDDPEPADEPEPGDGAAAP